MHTYIHTYIDAYTYNSFQVKCKMLPTLNSKCIISGLQIEGNLDASELNVLETRALGGGDGKDQSFELELRERSENRT